jgi:hypothetical protein
MSEVNSLRILHVIMIDTGIPQGTIHVNHKLLPIVIIIDDHKNEY